MAHSTGARPASNVSVALWAPSDRVVAKHAIGLIGAPLDLALQQRPFTLRGLPGGPAGCLAAIDSPDEIPEMYAGNRAAGHCAAARGQPRHSPLASIGPKSASTLLIQ